VFGISSAETDKCFNIRTQNGSGTAFIYSNEHGDVFLTAAHLMRGVMIGDYIYFCQIAGEIKLSVKELLIDPDGYDVAAFLCESAIAVPEHRDSVHSGIYLGQEMKFIGFPHGLKNDFPTESGFPVPLVRTAFFAGKIKIDGRELFLLDGFNNPGYSGSPVYCGRNSDAFLVGIVSGYKNEAGDASKIFMKDNHGNERQVTDYYLKSNSGLIYVVTLKTIRNLTSKFHQKS
jgi:hypothetical protein